VSTSANSSETLLAAAKLESGPAPYAQLISVGHHTVSCDEPAARGGGDVGPSPFGLLVAGLAGCTSITLRMYADRKGWDLGTIQVKVKMVRVLDTDRIERVIQFQRELTSEQTERLLEIAEKTPVTKTLRQGVTIATRLGP
jgi:putative redox protein